MASVKSKALIVGDGAIGKTCLLSRITNNAIDWSNGDVEYEPTTFNNYNITWDDEDGSGESRILELELWDTAGQEGFEQLRTLSYPGTDVYLVGYACNTGISLNNVEHKWMAEIKKCREENGEMDEAWVVLVGTKKDIRDGVTVEMAKAVAKQIKACSWVETSAKDNDLAASGVEKLISLMMTLGFMKAAGEPKPDWGSFPGDAEAPPAPAPAAAAAKKDPAVAVAPTTPPAKMEPVEKETEDKGCACVIT